MRRASLFTNLALTLLALTLSPESDANAAGGGRGSLDVRVSVQGAEELVCPVVTGITVLPLQVMVGGKVELEGATSRPASTLWSIAGSRLPGDGRFADASALSTTFRCERPGLVNIRLQVVRPGCVAGDQKVELECVPNGQRALRARTRY